VNLGFALKKGGIYGMNGMTYGTLTGYLLAPGKNRIATAITQRIGSNTVKIVVTAAFQPVVFAARTCVIPIGKTTATRKKATPIIMALLALNPIS